MKTVKVTKDLMKERKRVSKVMASWKINMRSSSSDLRDIAVRLGRSDLALKIHEIADSLYNATL